MKAQDKLHEIIAKLCWDDRVERGFKHNFESTRIPLEALIKAILKEFKVRKLVQTRRKG